MQQDFALIGFGEAGRTFALAGDWAEHVRVYDIKTDDEGQRAAKRGEYAYAGVVGCDAPDAALAGVHLALSLVTADQALAAAEAAAKVIAQGALYCDLNSVAPETKRAAAGAIEAAGAYYIDVAVMSPVDPARLAVPLLLSGTHAAKAKAALAALGFTKIEIVGDNVGQASAIKMIRSVMVKGLEALTAECVLAAEAAGVRADVLASLDASDKPKPWAERADYNLDRMMVHGLRRAAEMEEVVKTLETLGIEPLMTRGTVTRQRAIGSLGLNTPVEGLAAKLEQINAGRG